MFRASCVDMFLPILYIIYTHIYTNINIFIIALFYYNIYCIIRYRIYARHVTFIDRGSCRDSSPVTFSLCPSFSSYSFYLLFFFFFSYYFVFRCHRCHLQRLKKACQFLFHLSQSTRLTLLISC